MVSRASQGLSLCRERSQGLRRWCDEEPHAAPLPSDGRGRYGGRCFCKRESAVGLLERESVQRSLVYEKLLSLSRSAVLRSVVSRSRIRLQPVRGRYAESI